MKLIIILFISAICCISMYAQNTNKQPLRGQVVSAEDSEPVKGASLELKRKTVQSVTDTHGNFSLPDVSIGDTLLISHIGYKSQQITVTRLTDVVIKLTKSATELEEVTVSTGFQRLPKERATGSFTQIDNKLFNEQVGTNVLERLKYISNGIVPFPNRVGTSAKDQIVIRGLSTLTMTIQKPLIVVDNFEYQGDINNINPNDVENVTFLKDAAAGSIWGAKAANGVIVITTKKGRYNQKTKIELNSNVTVVDKPDLFYLKNISSNDLINVEQFLFSRDYRFSDTSNLTYPSFSPVYEILFKERNGQLSSTEAKAQIDALRNLDVRNDFNRHIYQKAVNQQYSINLRGGANNSAWFFSGGFDKNLSELNDSYNRINVSFGNIYKVARNLELSSSIFYTQSKAIRGRPAYGSIATVIGSIPTYSQLIDDNGNPLPLYTNYRHRYIDTLGAGKLLDWKYYPLEDYQHILNKTNLQDLNATLGINYKLLNSINIDIKYRYERQNSENQVLYDQQSYYARDLINSFSQLDGTTGVISYKVPKGEILDINKGTTTAQNIRGQINFNKIWYKHSLVVLAGSEISETINESNLYRTYGYNSNILTYGNVDYQNNHPLFISGSSFIPNPATFNKINTRFVSFYGNGAYTLNNKYSVSASFRRDASNLFGVDINDKWKPLWSTGISWNISKEPFYHAKFLPDLRLRITYGRQGNLDPGKVAVTTFTYLSANPYTFTPIGEVTNFINPDLKWEQVAMINAGVDFATKNRRISGSLEFYQKNITDLYGQTIIDGTTGLGVGSITKNIGSMRGRGIDIEINTVNIDRAVKWNTNFIFNTNSAKVIKYNDPPFNGGTGSLGGGLLGYNGYSPFSYFAYKWAGLDPITGNPQGYLDGQISTDYIALTGTGTKFQDLKYIGSLLPVIYGSVGNTISYKQLLVSLRVVYKFGYYFRRESINYTSLVNNLSGHSDYVLRWQKTGDELHTIVPSFIYPVNSARDNFYENSEALACKGDHIRLQYINLGYEISRIQFKKMPFENIQVYMVLNNLGIIWKANKAGIDPDYNSLPAQKSIATGIRIGF